jgi:thiol:disulfide interchange protein
MNAYTTEKSDAIPQRISSFPSDTESPIERYSYDLMNENDFEKAISSFEFIIVDVWAPWCKSCSNFSKRFEEEIGGTYETMIERKQLLLLKDNIENPDSYHKEQQLHVVPTFFVYRKNNKKEIKRFTGVDFNELLSFLVSFFTSPNTPPVSDTLPSSPPTPPPIPYDSYLKKTMTYRNFH